ncbi:MAG: hypothetical protein KHX53_01190 [Bacteroides sp.]|nr:hypothetical protein [Bacteroides sp.]
MEEDIFINRTIQPPYILNIFFILKNINNFFRLFCIYIKYIIYLQRNDETRYKNNASLQQNNTKLKPKHLPLFQPSVSSGYNSSLQLTTIEKLILREKQIPTL